MGYTDINGAWKSKAGLVYIVTQLDDKFVWRVVHPNKVTETGIGWFIDGKDINIKVQWNCHGGNTEAKIRHCNGKVVDEKNRRACQIEWNDVDHFIERITP